MKLIGFNYKKISVEKHKEVEQGFKINTSINITNLEKREVDIFKGQDTIHFEYSINIKYEKGFADLTFEGSIFILFNNNKDYKQILKEWQNDKKIPEKIKIDLFNIIMARCNLKALELEEDFNLPSHIPFPRLVPPSEIEKDK